MRKGLIGTFAVVVLATLLILILIPKQIYISQITTIRASESSIWRYVSDETKWINWWPTERNKKRLDFNSAHYSYNGFNFRRIKLLYNALDVEIKNNELAANGKLVMIPLAIDSILIQWQTVLPTTYNPFNKIIQYQRAKKIKETMAVILDSMKAFNEDKDRVYKFNIHHTTLKDTCLVATKKTARTYPSIPVIYEMINHLRKYIAEQGAKETNYPMLNISKSDSDHYTAMVAIATDKKLNGKGDIAFKRMIIYKDKVLAADVKGGAASIQQAYDEIHAYMSDYKLSVPVIHFEYLETDRLKETDTSKWVTRIYFPII